MTFADFKTEVAAYIGRDYTSFQRGTVNLLDRAVNNAKRWAQRRCDFPQVFDRGFVSTHEFGVPITSISSSPSGSPTISVAKVFSAWRYATTTNPSGQTDYVKVAQYEFIQEPALKDILPPYLFANITPNTLPVTYKIRCYVRGLNIYLTGFSQPESIWVDVFKKLPDYVLDADTDFLITDYEDWMLLRTLVQLNFYLKEDQRLQISAGALQEAWDSVLADANRLNDASSSGNNLD